jgi:ribonuclease P protein component
LTFSKAVRLRKRGEFQRVAREGKRLVGKYLCVDYRPAGLLKLGISASARFGSSPERSRFKRLVREAFRKSYALLPPLELNVVPRQLAKNARCADIEHELIRLLS